MHTHLVLLSGINVSGHNMIKMDALKKALENNGYQNVITYTQSSNVFLTTDEEDAATVSFKVKQLIFTAFGFDVPCIIITKNNLEACFKNNSFFKEQNSDTKQLYVAFVSKDLNTNAINDLKMSSVKPDLAQVDGALIYLKYISGAGKTKLDQRYIKKKLNTAVTIRNWNTITKLLEMYNEYN